MRDAVERTGGVSVLAESFAHEVFRQSFARMLAGNGEFAASMASGAVFEVIPSRDVKVQGLIGPVRVPRGILRGIYGNVYI